MDMSYFVSDSPAASRIRFAALRHSRLTLDEESHDERETEAQKSV